ncbi:MAG: tetratricopeptide repeat protein [Clostridium sp.]
MTYKLNYNFLKLEFKKLYNAIIEIEENTDLEVKCKSILKLLKDIIEIIYRENEMILSDDFFIAESIGKLYDKGFIPTEIVDIINKLESDVNDFINKPRELGENALENNISDKEFAKIYEAMVWIAINYGEEDYSLFFNKLNLKEKLIFSKYLQKKENKKALAMSISNVVNSDQVEDEITEYENNIDEDEEEDDDGENEEVEYDYVESGDDDESIELVDKGEKYYFGRGIDKDIYKARRYFEKAARLGNEYGEVYLGLFYEKGLGGEQDIGQALYWYKKAAIKGNAFAEYSIGYLYFNGEGVEQNYEYAFTWYKKSAENGFPAAQHALAYLYKMGEGCEESIFKAYYWLEEAADNGFEDSFYVLGESYFEGVFVDLNYKKAFKYLSKAAEIGDESALESLGDMYYFGFYVDEDKKKAFKLYKESIEGGNVDLYYKLGKIYEDEGKYKSAINYYKKGHKNNDVRSTQKLGVIFYNGENVVKDIKKSLEYMEVAAQSNEPHALYVMGVANLNTDKNKAIKYLKEAYRLGSIHAAEALASELLIEVLNDKKIDEKKLLEYVNKAKDGDLEDGIYYYGLVQAYGLGVKKNNEEAFKYFKIAADKKCEKAIIKLGNWYKHGIYVKPNPCEAIKWYKKAAEMFNSEALASIVEIYEKGIGIEPNYKRAFEGAKLLREASVVDGNLKLAYYYLEGIGTEIDVFKAEKIIEETMELDEGKTLKFLGELAESGIYKNGGTKAITYYRQAIENGCIEAQANIEYYLYKKIKGIKDNENYSYTMQSGKESYLKAIKIFELGKENKNDSQIEKGIRALKRSVQQGFYPAIIDIVKYYEKEEETRDNLINLSKYRQKAEYYNLKM